MRHDKAIAELSEGIRILKSAQSYLNMVGDVTGVYNHSAEGLVGSMLYGMEAEHGVLCFINKEEWKVY